jgi:hypothetical protein
VSFDLYVREGKLERTENKKCLEQYQEERIGVSHLAEY